MTCPIMCRPNVPSESQPSESYPSPRFVFPQATVPEATARAKPSAGCSREPRVNREKSRPLLPATLIGFLDSPATLYMLLGRSVDVDSGGLGGLA